MGACGHGGYRCCVGVVGYISGELDKEDVDLRILLD